MEDESIHYFRL